MASAVCFVCQRRVRIYVPAAGDGSCYVYSSHKNKDGQPCYGGKGVVEDEALDAQCPRRRRARGGCNAHLTTGWRRGMKPLRKIVATLRDEKTGRIIERLECGHEQKQKTDIYGPTNAYPRRCAKCAAAQPEEKKEG